MPALSPLYGPLLAGRPPPMAATCSAASRSRSTAASPPPAAPRIGSAARRTSSTPIGCARCSMRWWSAPARCARMTRSSPRARCEGPSPVRVVLDTDRRLDARLPRVPRGAGDAAALRPRCARRATRVGHAPVLRLPRAGEGLDIAAVLAALAARGLRRMFVEGGGITVSRFLAAGALDRLHVTIAPLLIGSGIPAFTLPEAATLTDGLRFDWSVHRIGADLLVDIPLSARGRPPRMTEARAFWTVAPGRGEIRGETLPPARRGSGAGAHAGQRRFARHRGAGVRRPRPAEPAPGDARAADGRRVSVSGEIRLQRGRPRRRIGRRVFVLHPHQDVFLAPAAMCIPVPDAVPTQRAVLAANMETALNVAWDAAPLAGERMLVIGAGVVGLLTASLLARIPGRARHRGGHRSQRARPWRGGSAATSPSPERGAGRAGADRACIGQRSRAASGAGPRRLRGAHRRGELVSATTRRAVPLGEAFHARRLRLIATQVGAVAPPMRGRRSHAERLATGARTAGRCPIRRAAGRADAISRICRRQCRASSRPAACATSSPMGPSECSASPSATTS